MSLKIAFTGSHSTGKTTLIERVEKDYVDKIYFIKEVARNVIAKGFPFGKDANIYSYITYVNDQIKAEMSFDETKYKVLLSDRTILDTACYAVINKSLPRPFIPDSLIEMLERVWFHEKNFYDCFVYFPIEFSMVADNVRPSGEEYRQQVSNLILEMLQKHKVKYLTVSGSVEQRYSQFKQLLNQYKL